MGKKSSGNNFEKISTISIQTQGLTIAPKLKREHLQLTSHSQMRVDLAAQVRMHTMLYTPHILCTHHVPYTHTRVHTHHITYLTLTHVRTHHVPYTHTHMCAHIKYLTLTHMCTHHVSYNTHAHTNLPPQVLSKTVANVFAYFGDPATEETQRFVTMFDKLFDCLNVQSKDQWIHKLKPDLKPYTIIVDDPRFKVCVGKSTCIVKSFAEMPVLSCLLKWKDISGSSWELLRPAKSQRGA